MIWFCYDFFSRFFITMPVINLTTMMIAAKHNGDITSAHDQSIRFIALRIVKITNMLTQTRIAYIMINPSLLFR